MGWLYNFRTKGGKENDLLSDPAYWETPSFVQIRKKKTKRLSPYSETEIWDRDEILSVVKYEPYKRNKAALTLLWDLDARNHEITLLNITSRLFAVIAAKLIQILEFHNLLWIR
jgi:integrase/recombinase XerD